VDLSSEYEREVFKPSIEEWRKGSTPNPDTLCNEKIKFGIFFDWCIAHGTDFVATGHYAQFLRQDDILPLMARCHLKTAVDSEKDQTYFLWAVPEVKLQKTLFPIGHLQKSEVRALAKRIGLPNAKRHDSQGLCFLGQISLEDMIEHELPQAKGSVLDEHGNVVGTHHGVAHYTLGQRHGFELAAKDTDTLPHYVVGKNVETNTITVSTNRLPKGKTTTHVALRDCNWIGEVAKGPCMARYRYRQTLIPASLCDDMASVTLHEPHYVPVGQSLVLYVGNRCLGGGVISDVKLT